MVREAEEFAEEDKKVQERITAKNSLESYLYRMKNDLDDDEKGISSKIEPAEKDELVQLIDEMLDWMEENPERKSPAGFTIYPQLNHVSGPMR